MNAFEQAKRTLAEREMSVQEQLRRDAEAFADGDTPSRPEAWSLADAYDRLLVGMDIPGADLIDFAEQQVDELAEGVGYENNAQTLVHVTTADLRALVLSSVCVMAQLWHTRKIGEGWPE